MEEIVVPVSGQTLLSAEAFKRLSDVPPEAEWFPASLHHFSNDHLFSENTTLSENFMKNLQHIAKSDQYVGYGDGKVWTIHPSTSSYGKWRAFNQRDPGEYRYGWTLTQLDTYFHTLSEQVQKQSAISKAQHMLCLACIAHLDREIAASRRVA